MTDPIQKEVKQAILLEKAKMSEEPEIGNQEPEIGNQEPEIGNQEPEIGNQEPEIGNQEPDIDDFDNSTAKRKQSGAWKTVYRKKSDITKKRGKVPESKRRHIMDAKDRSLWDSILRRDKERTRE